MPSIEEEQFIHLLQTNQKYRSRTKPLDNSSELTRMEPAEALENIIKSSEEESFLLDKVLEESVHFYRRFYEEMQELKKERGQGKQKIEDLRGDIESQKDEISVLKKEKQMLAGDLQHAREENLALNLKNQEVEKNYLAELKDLKQESQKQKLNAKIISEKAQQLQEQNRNLHKFIILHKEQEADMKDKISSIERERDILEGELAKLKNRITWEHKRRSNLEEVIEEKQRKSHYLNEELESLKMILQSPFDAYSCEDDDLPMEKKVSDFSINDKHLLSEDIGITESFESNHIKTGDFKNERRIRAQSQISGMRGRQTTMDSKLQLLKIPKNLQSSRDIKKNKSSIAFHVVDPYYCHFLLLAQSIKISENNDQYFNADIKPFYGELVREKVPMHEWSKWIKKKFETLAKGEKKNKKDKMSEETAEKTNKMQSLNIQNC